MIFPTINAAVQIGGLPTWAAVLIFIGIFIVSAAAAAFISYKLRMRSSNARKKDGEAIKK
ncbi:MAG: hypothetical protein NC093_08885 [Alistipes sp.]|nr:hypothetical protein [Alistipes sp.]